MEQLGFQEDLTIGDGNDVGRDIRRHVARLRFDDGQCGQRTAALGIAELRRAFQQTAVQVENVAGVGFTSRGTANQQRKCTVRDGVLGQVVINNEDVLALMHEIFAHGAAGVGGDIL